MTDRSGLSLWDSAGGHSSRKGWGWGAGGALSCPLPWYRHSARSLSLPLLRPSPLLSSLLSSPLLFASHLISSLVSSPACLVLTARLPFLFYLVPRDFSGLLHTTVIQTNPVISSLQEYKHVISLPGSLLLLLLLAVIKLLRPFINV